MGVQVKVWLLITIVGLFGDPAAAEDASSCGMNLRQLSENVFVAGQPDTEQLRCLADQGYTTVINSRTAKEMSQLGLDEAQAATHLGLRYLAAPIGAGSQFSLAELNHLQAAIDQAGGPVLMHCRSGRRSSRLYAALLVAQGLPLDQAIEQAGAGLDPSKVTGLIEPVAKSND